MDMNSNPMVPETTGHPVPRHAGSDPGMLSTGGGAQDVFGGRLDGADDGRNICRLSGWRVVLPSGEVARASEMDAYQPKKLSAPSNRPSLTLALSPSRNCESFAPAGFLRVQRGAFYSRLGHLTSPSS